MIDIMRNNLYRLLKYISEQQKHSFTQNTPFYFFLLYCKHRTWKSHGAFKKLNQQS